MKKARTATKCICPTPEQLNEYAGDVTNWPRWNLEDCLIHQGINTKLEKAADKLRDKGQSTEGGRCEVELKLATQ